jgi:predicted aspartyl protease
MSHVKVTIHIANAERREKAVDVPEALVDTGATWTTVPRALAQSLELPSLGPIRGHTAGGVQELEQSYAYVELQGKHGVTPILISDVMDRVLIGVVTLESLAFAVDPSTERLIDSPLLLL